MHMACDVRTLWHSSTHTRTQENTWRHKTTYLHIHVNMHTNILKKESGDCTRGKNQDESSTDVFFSLVFWLRYWWKCMCLYFVLSNWIWSWRASHMEDTRSDNCLNNQLLTYKWLKVRPQTTLYTMWQESNESYFWLCNKFLLRHPCMWHPLYTGQAPARMIMYFHNFRDSQIHEIGCHSS